MLPEKVWDQSVASFCLTPPLYVGGAILMDTLVFAAKRGAFVLRRRG
ncbi:hypothetical protein TC41_2454 [Alicyclobacillus acidocaldarius subsp. acidocaldarius Tc-4-1]|uniref:Uncharacterized protein n=1 Tax=Alicyclobacillus acidocaldarius (strain Tc-4-1) TaxID=1048834 RepID=F8IGZ9_ALIAT|nr:hypothetical protein TC41_2454 [Alicyclobacillus acidocaldarius subsp. acidocaldarius Tc-4-1]